MNKQNLFIPALLACVVLGFGIGTYTSQESETAPVKIRLTLVSSNNLLQDIPLSITKAGVGITFGTPLTNLTGIGISKIR